MHPFIPRYFGLAALALVLTTAGAAAPARAQTTSTEPSTAPSTAAPSTVTPAHRMSGHRVGSRRGMSPADAVDRRIADLHRRLHITADQEAQWAGVAQVMRDDAQAVEAVAKERQQALASMSAVDNLRSFQKVAQTHADGLNKLADAFAALYATMSDDQKKNADAVFRYQDGHGPRHRRGGTQAAPQK